MDLLPLLNDTIECSCEECTSACHRKPGWFLPEEIKPAAELFGMTEKEFFNKFLSVDYYGNEYDEHGNFIPNGFTFLLSPATNKSQPGEIFPFDPSGTCVFLKDGKCSIHAAKPFECKVYDHRQLISKDIHEHVAKAWLEHKDKIIELLGKEPKVESFSDLPIEEQQRLSMELIAQLPPHEQLKHLAKMLEILKDVLGGDEDES